MTFSSLGGNIRGAGTGTNSPAPPPLPKHPDLESLWVRDRRRRHAFPSNWFNENLRDCLLVLNVAYAKAQAAWAKRDRNVFKAAQAKYTLYRDRALKLIWGMLKTIKLEYPAWDADEIARKRQQRMPPPTHAPHMDYTRAQLLEFNQVLDVRGFPKLLDQCLAML